MKRRLAIDFDGTLSDSDRTWPYAGPPFPGAKEAMEKLIEDYDLIIYSCRTNLTMPERAFHLNEIKRFLKEYEIPYTKIDLGLEGKIVAFAYIDNAAISFNNNWNEIADSLT